MQALIMPHHKILCILEQLKMPGAETHFFFLKCVPESNMVYWFSLNYCEVNQRHCVDISTERLKFSDVPRVPM